MEYPQKGICGAIYGDIIGLPYELRANRTKDFHFRLRLDDFSDDTILTIAIAKWMLDGKLTTDALRHTLIDYSLRFRDKNVWGRGYQSWFESGGTIDRTGVASNGAAMRVSPVAYASDDISDVLEMASLTARLTHNSDEAERGAQAVAAAVFMARQGCDKEYVRNYIATHFGYNMQRTVEDIRPDYKFEIMCDLCVPESIICWLDSDNYEQAVRNAVSLGGDADTMAAIAGAIAAATPGMEVPIELAKPCFSILPPDFKDVVLLFNQKFGVS